MDNRLKIGIIWFGTWLVTAIITGVIYMIFASVANVGLVDFIVTVFFIIATSAFVTFVGVLLYEADRHKGTVTVGIVGALFILLLIVGSAGDAGSKGSGPPYSGTVASEDPLENQTTSHTLMIQPGERVKLEFQATSRGSWSIRLPESQGTVYGSVPASKNFSESPAISHEGGTFYYTANQTGPHKITISAEVHDSASYHISIQNTTD